MTDYNWKITQDHLDGEDVGVEGPKNFKTHSDNRADFQMFDDDGVLYYSGTIWGDYDGFEPLDDFGMPNAGCTEIRYLDKTGVL